MIAVVNVSIGKNPARNPYNFIISPFSRKDLLKSTTVVVIICNFLILFLQKFCFHFWKICDTITSRIIFLLNTICQRGGSCLSGHFLMLPEHREMPRNINYPQTQIAQQCAHTIYILQKYLKRANRLKRRDAKLWGLKQAFWVCDDSPAANISISLYINFNF